MKAMSKMNMVELRQYAVEAGVEKKKTYGCSKLALIVMIDNKKRNPNR